MAGLHPARAQVMGQFVEAVIAIGAEREDKLDVGHGVGH